MRILTLTNLYPNPYQAQRGQFNRLQFQALARQHELRVIAPIAWTDEWRFPSDSGMLPGRRSLCDGIDVVHPRYLFPPRMLRGWYGHFFRWSIRGAFQRLLADFRPQLVYAPWAYPDGWAAAALARQAGLPVVIKVHGSDILLLATHARRAPTSQALAAADAVVTVSRDLAARVMALGAAPDRVRVVYNGVDTERFHPGSQRLARQRLQLDGDSPLLLFVGNLLPVKAPEVLLEACAQLAARHVPFKCHLVGQGPLRQRLERQANRLGLERAVRLVGPRPHEELADWYRAADLVVLPSRSEGAPNVLIEAAACGKPFVASRVGGIPEIAHLAPSTLVPPGDAAALADAIQARLAAGPEVVTSARLRSHADAARELIELFDEILSRRRCPAA